MQDDYFRPFPCEVHEPTGRRLITIVGRRIDDTRSDQEILIGSDGKSYQRRLRGLGVVELSHTRDLP